MSTRNRRVVCITVFYDRATFFHMCMIRLHHYSLSEFVAVPYMSSQFAVG